MNGLITKVYWIVNPLAKSYNVFYKSREAMLNAECKEEAWKRWLMLNVHAQSSFSYGIWTKQYYYIVRISSKE